VPAVILAVELNATAAVEPVTWATEIVSSPVPRSAVNALVNADPSSTDSVSAPDQVLTVVVPVTVSQSSATVSAPPAPHRHRLPTTAAAAVPSPNDTELSPPARVRVRFLPAL